MKNIKKITKTPIKDLYILELNKFIDDRGNFQVIFNDIEFKKNKINNKKVIQVNLAFSKKKYTLRGMHYQVSPYSQAKLVYLLSGKILDVVIDLRKSSSTYNKTFSIKLEEGSNKMLYVPRGLAHGYLTLSKNVNFLYVTDNIYNKNSERCYSWKNNKIYNLWPKNSLSKIIISKKDNIS